MKLMMLGIVIDRSRPRIVTSVPHSAKTLDSLIFMIMKISKIRDRTPETTEDLLGKRFFSLWADP